LKERARVVRVNTWDEFKRLATALRPNSIAYTLQRAPLSRPPVGLRLVFAAENIQYVFLDFAQGETLRRTKISVYFNETGEAYIRDEDIKSFILTQLNRIDLSIISFEALGY